MCNILYICSFFCLTFGLVYGNQCDKNYGKYMGCYVYKVEAENQCQSYVRTTDGKGNFLFYIKPFTKGQLSISLHKRHSHHSSREINNNLFSILINEADVWYKIKVRRGKARRETFAVFNNIITPYFLEVNDQQVHHIDIPSNQVKAGNEIRVKTVTSLWSFTCDPRLYQPPTSPLLPLQPPQPLPPAQTGPSISFPLSDEEFDSTEEEQSSSQPTSAPLSPTQTPPTPPQSLQPLSTAPTADTGTSITDPTQAEDLQPPPRTVGTPDDEDIGILSSIAPTTNTDTHITDPTPAEDLQTPPRAVGTPKDEDAGFLESIASHEQLATIATAALVLTLMVIPVTVSLVLRYKRKKPDPFVFQPWIQPTDHQSRLSRHTSENSLYDSYDNHTMGQDEVTHVVGPTTGTVWGGTAGTWWGGHGTFGNRAYEEVNPQGTSVTPVAYQCNP